MALGFGYLTRNEAALAAVMGGLAVGVVSYGRAVRKSGVSDQNGLPDLVIFGAPAFTAAVGWAICSYVIIGAWLDGGALSTRLAHQKGNGGTIDGRILYEFHAIGALAPFLPLLLVVAAFVAFRRRDPGILAPLSVLGGAWPSTCWPT